MARLDKKVLGKVTGKLGDQVFRNFNNETFISIRPSSYKTGKSITAKANRIKFAAGNQFAKTVFSNDVLKSVWVKAFPEERLTYNTILKNNLKCIVNGYPTNNNNITPLGFIPPFEKASISDGRIKIFF